VTEFGARPALEHAVLSAFIGGQICFLRAQRENQKQVLAADEHGLTRIKKDTEVGVMLTRVVFYKLTP
jgi:hypothetical protein